MTPIFKLGSCNWWSNEYIWNIFTSASSDINFTNEYSFMCILWNIQNNYLTKIKIHISLLGLSIYMWYKLYWRLNFSNWGPKEDCRSGFSGDRCQQKCQYPNFGRQCKGICNCKQTLCHYKNGCPPLGNIVLIIMKMEVQSWREIKKKN